ncbi:osmoprotectant NAGGN system M42 family peptidase [Hahella aquimaris]|uniref:osmoprotectant NAGGN system M42 family peptidase n=1 Tax=Hahella sp. HNIBRBA332 TaxID=3015983 RepID=UPI00273B3712|nr:osmoprotectant NAGGN system M42 family peptidase [Hahella sp. HNIBRBA332]WLQ11627.1 osmoprotectant NAGGN system M42 family peptidase [Hahella sp. HNIBRBA332]
MIEEKGYTLDSEYLTKVLLELLAIPCPSGFTDGAVVYVCERLSELGIDYELTRRGTIKGRLQGKLNAPQRAVVTHLDTIGAMVREIKPNGRLCLTPVGHWSSRFAEGSRVTIFSDGGCFRGSVLPLYAAGHRYNEEVDRLPVTWDHVEIRVDECIYSKEDALRIGICVGDFVAFDPNPEFLPNGFVVSRHLDNKAGTAALLTGLKAIVEHDLPLAMDCLPIFTLTEEIGSGVGHAIEADVTEFVGIDIGPVAEGQNAKEHGVTIAMKDSSGPFDWHLTRHLIHLCQDHNIPHQRDVFRYYYSDAVSAVQAGHDIRHALVTFGTDATHGYERTHIDALTAISDLVVRYAQSEPVRPHDAQANIPKEDFQDQITWDEMQFGGTAVPTVNEVLGEREKGGRSKKQVMK